MGCHVLAAEVDLGAVALAPDEARHQVWEAQAAAVDAAVGYLTRHACVARLGRDGVDRQDGSDLGFLRAEFTHRCSREGDPQIHTAFDSRQHPAGAGRPPRRARRRAAVPARQGRRRASIGPDRIAARQRAMYECDRPFGVKWRQAMTWFDEDLASGYPKLVAELGAAARNLPACRLGYQRAIQRWASILRTAVTDAAHQFGLDVDDDTIAGVAGLIRTSQQAMLEDRLAGIDTDHTQIVAFITRLIDDLERRPPKSADA